MLGGNIITQAEKLYSTQQPHIITLREHNSLSYHIHIFSWVPKTLTSSLRR